MSSRELDSLKLLKVLAKIDNDRSIKKEVDKEYKKIEKSLKALEIIKNLPWKYKIIISHFLGQMWSVDYYISNKEYKLLRKVLL